MTVEEATARFPKEAGIARFGEPEEIAYAVGFFIEDKARWITGANLAINGGQYMGW